MRNMRNLILYANVGWLWASALLSGLNFRFWIEAGNNSPEFKAAYFAVVLSLAVGGAVLLQFTKPKIKASLTV